jgi:hypothetical protein
VAPKKTNASLSWLMTSARVSERAAGCLPTCVFHDSFGAVSALIGVAL